ncbi:hypothetical protein D9C01_13190, partial [Corynebacterium diphtheriae]
QGAGVMITVDEIHTIGSDELDQLAAVAQHLIRDEAEIVLVMAGIPQAVDQMIADNAQRTPSNSARSSQDCSVPRCSQGAGVMITVDEIHTIGSDELDQLAAVAQHLIR